MLHLRSSNGYQNVFALEVFSHLYANTINTNYVSSTQPPTQFNPASNLDYSALYYWIKFTNQLTQKSYWGRLGQDFVNDDFPRSISFFLFLDGYVGTHHINIDGEGLYDYSVYSSTFGNDITSENDSRIISLVNNGMAMVHNDNYKNDHYQNSQNGVTPSVIPNSVSYNG